MTLLLEVSLKNAEKKLDIETSTLKQTCNRPLLLIQCFASNKAHICSPVLSNRKSIGILELSFPAVIYLRKCKFISSTI